MSADAKEVAETLDSLKKELRDVRVKAKQCEDFAASAGASLVATLIGAEQSLSIGKVALDELADALSHATSPVIAQQIQLIQFLATQSRTEGLSTQASLQAAEATAMKAAAYSKGATALLTELIRSLPLEKTVAAEQEAALFASSAPLADALRSLEDAFNAAPPVAANEGSSPIMHLSEGVSSSSGATVVSPENQAGPLKEKAVLQS